MEKALEGSMEASRSRTNTIVRGEPTELSELNEKTSVFDVRFKAKNPTLSDGHVIVNLRVDIEPQKNYRPGYPIEKRGLYYLARSLGAQLSLLTENTDYSGLEKCCSTWEGRRQGIQVLIESFKEVGNSKEAALEKLKEKFSLTEEAAEQYMACYWK